jgi:H+/Cl- antiporter ClcA/PII-like signaling protein
MMTFRWHPAEQVRIGRFLLKWTLLASGLGVLAGSASAVFLLSLEYATAAREDFPWLLYLLPVAGCLIVLLYQRWCKGCEDGNNLLIEEIHRPEGGVPSRLAPVILLSTIATHLFGGSAGREGTALQMGGSLAAWLSRRLGLDPLHTRTLLMAGISAGFGSVFGTPLAGMVFGLEVLAVGRLRYDALIPCLVASVVGHWTCAAWGVHHTHYAIENMPEVSALLVGKVVLASLVFALVSVFFAEITHWLGWVFKRVMPWAPGRPILGASVIIALVWLLGTRDYLGLGIPIIIQSFRPEGVATWAFAWKLLFTAITLSSGFKGGEVTPLFFIGATLGCTLGWILGVPNDFMAALGFVAVFAGAANTPLACTIMGIELFGARHGVFLALACCSTYVWSGHRGIYLSQIVDTPKTDDSQIPVETTLEDVRQNQPALILSLGSISRLSQRVFSRTGTIPLILNGEPSMKQKGTLCAQKVGVVRIFLSAGDRRPGRSWRQRLFSRPLYQEIIDLAREQGLWGATALGLTYGFTDAGKTTANFHPDVGFTNTHIYVELIAPRDQLEAFIERIASLISSRVVTFAELEHWGERRAGFDSPDREVA